MDKDPEMDPLALALADPENPRISATGAPRPAGRRNFPAKDTCTHNNDN